MYLSNDPHKVIFVHIGYDDERGDWGYIKICKNILFLFIQICQIIHSAEMELIDALNTSMPITSE